jgi:hypothetical protein
MAKFYLCRCVASFQISGTQEIAAPQLLLAYVPLFLFKNKNNKTTELAAAVALSRCQSARLSNLA